MTKPPQDQLTVPADAAGLDAAVAAISAGHPIIIPTDTVYGLAVIAGDRDALERLFRLKNRPEDRSVAVLVSDLDQAEALGHFSDPARAAAIEHWPGALTLVAERRAYIADCVGSEDGTIGIRCPGHPFVRELARRVGPLSTTSANLSGRPTPGDPVRAAAGLAGPVALIVDGGRGGDVASTVARIDDDGTVTIFRLGDVDLDDTP